MLCPCCLTVPSVIIKLLATASALSCSQRFLTKNSNKWVRRISFVITLLISLALVGVGLFLLVLVNNDDLRSRGFAHFCSMQNLKDGGPMDEIRCSILNKADISGRVLEFGPGPGTNFKCLVNNSTTIDDYVGVEPNVHFKEKMMLEKVPAPFREAAVSGTEAYATEHSHEKVTAEVMTNYRKELGM